MNAQEISHDVNLDPPPYKKQRMQDTKPVVTNLEWIDNGKVLISFEFIPPLSYKSELFEIYYCYINDVNNWFKYASNKWKTIKIALNHTINANIELNIATCSALHDFNKNKDIELLIKIRCLFRDIKWSINAYWSDFSSIYFVESISIPNILIKHTKIDTIINDMYLNTNENKPILSYTKKKEFHSIYKSFANIKCAQNSVIKLLIKYVSNFYSIKSDLWLQQLSPSLYLIHCEYILKFEEKRLKPFIDNCSNQKLVDSIKHELINKHKDKLLSSNSNFIKNLLQNLISFNTNYQTAKQDIARLYKLYSRITGAKRQIAETLKIFIANTGNEYIQNSKSKESKKSIKEVTNADKLKFNQLLTDLSLNCEQPIFHSKTKWRDILNDNRFTSDPRFSIFSTCPKNVETANALFETHCWNIIDELVKPKKKLKQFLKSQNYTISQLDTVKQLIDKFYDKMIENSIICNIPHLKLLFTEMIAKQKYLQNKNNYNVDDNDSKKYECDINNEHKLIHLLIRLHKIFSNVIKSELQNEEIFYRTLKESFEEAINKEYYTSALLARFANDILKKGTKATISDLDTTMYHIAMLYAYIRDKDIFERDYQQYLASRLLQNLSESEQSERSMIGKLKNETGYHWISKLEDMFKDIQRSKELMVNFKKEYNDSLEMEINVSVCTTGAWPTASIEPVKKPADIASVSDTFTQFYVNRFSGRRLNYQMDKGTADIAIIFNTTTRKILVVSTYQMIVLLLFNHQNTLTWKQIKDATNIPSGDLYAATMSMAHPRIKVLRKAPNTKQVEDSHKFQINPKYSHPAAKIAIPTLNIKVTDKSKGHCAICRSQTESRYRSRRHQMDAAIVRVMCARNTLQHNDLVYEVIRQLSGRFTPTGKHVRKRICNLRELEYLSTDENDKHIYHYNGGGGPYGVCGGCSSCDKYDKQSSDGDTKDICPGHSEIEKKHHYDNKMKTTGSGSMKVFIKSLEGNKCQVGIEETFTVKEVKLLIQELEGICAEQLRVIFKGKLLWDAQTMKDVGVEAGMTLHTAIMLRGS